MHDFIRYFYSNISNISNDVSNISNDVSNFSDDVSKFSNDVSNFSNMYRSATALAVQRVFILIDMW